MLFPLYLNRSVSNQILIISCWGKNSAASIRLQPTGQSPDRRVRPWPTRSAAGLVVAGGQSHTFGNRPSCPTGVGEYSAEAATFLGEFNALLSTETPHELSDGLLLRGTGHAVRPDAGAPARRLGAVAARAKCAREGGAGGAEGVRGRQDTGGANSVPVAARGKARRF